ncbi:segregation and condensation protein A [Salinicoccus kekensis]|uniref:Segregation and condensation protein A n=1 Tax=Salinicoccus kekensis TaxID=714307 RepID=A0A285UA56_9STAP|nr:segregation/condensation protein A [Salinicoccus kekensis]SOC38784.1 condensin subunit ScpA [Salinicoccus kekensis]
MRTYEVKLEVFEGPLDLLLHLIRELEIDIYDIPMATLTAQYMEYINQMKELEINVASEYLVMASELLKIKSFMLLPEPAAVEADFEDPREQLMEQLLEYQNYKQYAEELSYLKMENDKTFIKAPHEFEESGEGGDEPDLTLAHLLEAYQKVRMRVSLTRTQTVSIRREVISKEYAESYINEKFSGRRALRLTELFSLDESRAMVVALFMVVLDWVKAHKMNITTLDDGEFQFERQQ